MNISYACPCRFFAFVGKIMIPPLLEAFAVTCATAKVRVILQAFSLYPRESVHGITGIRSNPGRIVFE
jgi:hypothetical protein